jgi:hypothetical protein
LDIAYVSNYPIAKFPDYKILREAVTSATSRSTTGAKARVISPLRTIWLKPYPDTSLLRTFSGWLDLDEEAISP